jgi:hypothetical protein
VSEPAERRPNPRRITIALDAAELYGPQVDIDLGGVEPMVDQWESGMLIPSREQIEALAQLTGCSPEFFYMPDPAPLVGWACRRSGSGRGCVRIDERPSAQD